MIVAESVIAQTLVQRIRANNAAFAAAVASVGVAGHTWSTNRIFEDLAPPETPYPFLTYTTVSAESDDDFTGRMGTVQIDVSAWSDNPVEADSLDQLVGQTLEQFGVDGLGGLTTLFWRRTSGFRGKETDAAGNVYRRGGTYSILNAQVR